MSIHISAGPDDIADTILLPGDPLRARFIAETFFKNPVCVNEVRAMYCFTGTYKGRRVSVMGTGMGQPSLSIYVNELFREYGVQTAIRVGSAGSLRKNVRVRDLILAMSVCSNGAMNKRRFGGMDYAPTANFDLLKAAHNAATASDNPVHVGPVLATDSFYDPDPEAWKLWANYGVLAVEMESAELYTLAAQYGRRALSILTVSDSIVDPNAAHALDDREKGFTDMAAVALEAALAVGT